MKSVNWPCCCCFCIIEGYNPDAGPEQYGKPDELVRIKQIELQKHQREYTEKERQLQLLRDKIRTDLLKERSKHGAGANTTDENSSAVKNDAGNGVAGASSNSAEHVYAGYKHSEEVASGVGTGNQASVLDSDSPSIKKNDKRHGKLVSSVAYGENDIVQGVYPDHHSKNRH